MAHVVGSALQDHLCGGTVFGMDHNGTAEVHRALTDGLLDHAEHVVAQFTALLGTQELKLFGGEDRGVVRTEGEGIHDHKGQGGGADALQAQKASVAASEGEQQKTMFRLKAEEPVREREKILMLVFHRAEVFGVDLQKDASSYPKDGSSVQELIDNAVVVIRAAKEEPEREYVAFSRSMLGSRQSTNELNLRLNASVSNHFKGFRIVVQPQVYADSGQIYGGEVLLRWEDDQVAVSPSVFIPILEQMGLIVSVGKWIIRQTVQLCKRILPDHPDFKLSFNVSYLQIIDQRLFPFLRRMLAETGLPGKNLMIELTESHSDTLPKQLEQFIEQCKGLGISFALDDFGSGYSGVQRLLQYPVDLVKFDRALVSEMSTSQQKLDFIVSTIHTCHEFNKKVCMEGVERREEWDLIRQTECDFIQGYYFYHPLELDEFCQVLAEKRKGTED